ncbi:MAG: DUF91 domain-containing protein [Sphingomonadaceae bacterium]|nr:DUF91 domain-containing protein [Sphingomonadaceae bacterium]
MPSLGGLMRADYRRWLEAQEYSANTIATQLSYASRAEDAYGDLAAHFASDRLAAVLDSLRYSTDDRRRGRPNPAKVKISGDLYNTLASVRSAVGLYRRFLDGGSETPVPPSISPAPVAEQEPVERIGLERDLQKSLRRDIAQLDPALTIIDDGVERSVASGFIDILARDASGANVVIELKAGRADRTAIGQLLSYMGDIADEEPEVLVRGILVAHDFDGKAKAAARVVPAIALRAYSVRFAFTDAST